MKPLQVKKPVLWMLSALTIALAAGAPSSSAAFGTAEKAARAAEIAEAAQEARKNRLPRVEVAVVSRLTRAEQGISTTSTLKPYEEVIVIPKVTGRIARRAAATGDVLKSGDLLMVLDSRSQKAEYASLQAQVAVKKAELEQSKVTLADAKRELDRYSRLRKSGYATQQEYDTRSTAYRSALAAEAKAAAQVKQAQAGLDAQNVLLGEYELRSPIDGVVLDDYDLAAGALLTPSAKALRVGRVDRLKADVDIAERDMGRLRPGMDAVLTFEALPGQTFYGTVTLIAPYINTSTRTVGAEITVDNQATGCKLRPGMFARVLLVESSEENPLAIPGEALRRDGTVAVIREGKAVIQPVTVGVASGGLITVSRGLKVGEAVVTSGGMTLKDGDEVNVVSGESAETAPRR